METNERQLWFSSRMDNTQLKADADKTKASLKEIGDTAKVEGAKIESAFDQASQNGFKSFAGMTTNLKQQIQLQQQLIREIAADIRNYQNELSNTTNPKLRSSLEGEIAGGKRALVEANGQLIAMQRQQVEGNMKEEESQSSLIGSLGKWAIGLASVAAAIKIGKAIIESTATGVEFLETAINQAAAATHYFFQSINTGNFDNFGKGMQIAIEGAKKYTEEMEKVQNMRNQDLVTTPQIDKDIADAYIEITNRAGKNTTQQLKDIDDYLGLIKTKYKPLIETAKEAKDAILGSISTQTGGKVSTSQLQEFISKYRDYEEMLKKGKRYNVLQDYLTQNTGPQVSVTGGTAAVSQSASPQDLQKARDEIKALGNDAKEAGKYVSQIMLVPQPARAEAAKAINAWGSLIAAQEGAGKRMQMRRGTLEAEELKQQETDAKKAKQDAELDNRIKVTEDLMKHANDQERDAIAKRLVLLLQEKNLIEAKNKSALAQASNQLIESKGAPTWEQAIREMAKAGGIDLDNLKLKNTSLEITKLNKGIAERTKIIEKDEKANVKATNTAIKNARLQGESYVEQIEILKASYLKGEITAEDYYKKLDELEAKQSEKRKSNILEIMTALSQMTGATGAQAQKIDEAMSAFGKFVKGDYIGGIIQFGKGFINALSGGTSAEKQAAEYEKLTMSITHLADVFGRLDDQMKRAFGVDKLVVFNALLSLAEADLGTMTEKINVAIKDINAHTLAYYNSFVATYGIGKEELTNPKNYYAQLKVPESLNDIPKAAKEAEAEITRLYTLLNAPSVPGAMGPGGSPVGNLALDDKQRQSLTLLLASYKDYYDKLTDLQNQYNQQLTNLTADSITSSIVDGFKNGWSTVAEFGQNFEDMMHTAILKSIQTAFLDKQLQDWYQQLATDLQSNGGLDKNEVADLKTQYNSIVTNAQNAINAADSIAGISPQSTDTTRTAATKGLASMSQDTANELNGRFTAIQGHTFSINEGMKILQSNSEKALQHLAGIETNTSRLETIEVTLSAVKSGIDDINLKGITLKK